MRNRGWTSRRWRAAGALSIAWACCITASSAWARADPPPDWRAVLAAATEAVAPRAMQTYKPVRVVAPGGIGWTAQFFSRAPENVASDRSLASLVNLLNEHTKHHRTGQHQPALTVDEVVAKIRSWSRGPGSLMPDADDQTYAIYQRIAETRMVPPGTWLSAENSWSGIQGKYQLEVWWIDLEIMNPFTGHNEYNFRIRNRTITSRTLSEIEVADMKREQEEMLRDLKENHPGLYARLKGEEDASEKSEVQFDGDVPSDGTGGVE